MGRSVNARWMPEPQGRRHLLRRREEVQRLLELSDLPDGKGTAAFGLIGTTHTWGVTCYLVKEQSPVLTETEGCNKCATGAPVGPMARCVVEDVEHAGWTRGAYTNGYYKG